MTGQIAGQQMAAKKSLEERARFIVASVFQVEQSDIGPESSQKTIQEWDSMGHLMLTLELEQEFGVQIPPHNVERMTTLAAIVETLRRCGAE